MVKAHAHRGLVTACRIRRQGLKVTVHATENRVARPVRRQDRMVTPHATEDGIAYPARRQAAAVVGRGANWRAHQTAGTKPTAGGGHHSTAGR